MDISVLVLRHYDTVMHSAPIFMDLGSIRSNGQNLELDPLQIHEFPIGSRFDPDPIQIQGLST